MRPWTAFKIGLFGALTMTMVFHWEVEETKAEPVAIIATDGVTAPAEDILFAERVPEGHWVDMGIFKTYGYCNCRRCCGKWAGGKTKTGTVPVEGRTVAVDPRVIPLGSMLMIDGQIRYAEDTGSGIKGNKIDTYYDSHQVASDHGIKHQRVFLWVEE